MDAINTALNGKQNTLTIDSALSTTSTNPVQNKVIKSALDGKQNTLTIDSALSTTSTNPVQNKAVKTALDGKMGLIDVNNRIKAMLPSFSVLKYPSSAYTVSAGGYDSIVDNFSSENFDEYPVSFQNNSGLSGVSITMNKFGTDSQNRVTINMHNGTSASASIPANSLIVVMVSFPKS